MFQNAMAYAREVRPNSIGDLPNRLINGLVFTGGVDFVVSQNGKSGPSIFIFDTEDGTIVGWSPAVDTTNGVIAVPNDHGAIYKGLAIAKTPKGSFLYASDFPHEGHTAELCRAEIHELLMREDLTDAHKQAVLADNAERFYPLAR